MTDEQTVRQDIWPVVENLIAATVDEDPTAVAQALVPESQAADALDLFGTVVFDVLLKTVLGRDRLGLARAIEAEDGAAVFVEYVWPDPEAEDGGYTAVDVVSVRLTQQKGCWLVTEVNPAAIDLPLNAPRALSVLTGAKIMVEDGKVPAEPWILPFTLMGGLLQLAPRPEALQDEVENLLIPGLQERQFGLLSILNGRRLWRDYVAVAAPNLEPAGAWAAALETIMTQQNKLEQTQATIGRHYGIGLAAVATHAKQIKTTLKIIDPDDRYSELQTTHIVYEESNQ